MSDDAKGQQRGVIPRRKNRKLREMAKYESCDTTTRKHLQAMLKIRDIVR
jgi:hypothetical protein